MKLANCERYCIQFQKYDHIFDGKCRGKDQTTSFEGTRGGGGLFPKLSDHLFVTYTRTYIKCPVVSLQFRRLLRAKLRFKLATVTLSDRPCLIKSWSGRCGKGIGKNVKSIAPPLPNPLKPSPRRGGWASSMEPANWRSNWERLHIPPHSLFERRRRRQHTRNARVPAIS